jgi:hypothetical protein
MPSAKSALPGGAALDSLVSQVARGGPSSSAGDSASAAESSLLTRAASILAQEAARIPSTFLGTAAPGAAGPLANLQLPGGQALGSGVDLDRLRRYAHEVIETLLTPFSPKVRPLDDRVPLLRCVAPVNGGSAASAAVHVANEEAEPSEVTLYCSNFIADCGYEIPALRVEFLPRTLTIAPKSMATFEVKIAVPQQAPPGLYSGLVQAAGNKYVKAIVSVEVK